MFAAMLHPLHKVINEGQYEKHLCMQSIQSLRETWMISQQSHREVASCYNHKLTPCIVRKKLEHKGGRRQLHDAYIVHTAVGTEKAHLRMKATSNSEEIKPVALSIVKLCLAGGTWL